MIPDASAQDMEVDAPVGGAAHMEIEEPAAQGEPAAQTDGPAVRGEPELLIVENPTVTAAGQQADPAGSAAGRRQPVEPVVLEEDAATAAGREQQHEPPRQQQQQRALAPQPGVVAKQPAMLVHQRGMNLVLPAVHGLSRASLNQNL